MGQWLCCADDTFRWFLGQCRAVNNTQIPSSLADIDGGQLMEQPMYYSIYHDPVTGLPNRKALAKRLVEAMGRTRTENSVYVLFHVHLCGLRTVLDILGPLVGEELLWETAHRLRQNLDPAVMIAHLEGGEFGVLLETPDAETSVFQILQSIEEVLRKPLTIQSQQAVYLKARIGMVTTTDQYRSPEDMLHDAAIAMRYSPNPEKTCCSHREFDQSMYEQVSARLSLEYDLHKALENNEFILYLQPIVKPAEERIGGFEALLRWQHPRYGLQAPAAFIDCLEETGLIVPVGWWVLQQACHQLKALQQQFPNYADLTVSINLSAKQFLQADLVQRVVDSLHEADLPASALKLEITESIMMDDTEAAIAKIAQLKALGVACHIDDFGTGYSSLSYLHRLPSAALKLDRSFVDGMMKSRDIDAIVQAVVTLAHQLGMYVVAEGVETGEQLQRIRELGCEYVQGYWCFPPLDQKTVVKVLAEQEYRYNIAGHVN